MITEPRVRTTAPPNLRKLVLTTHVVSSIGWLGAILVFIALSVIGLTSQDERLVRGVYLVMEPVAWYVLLPLASASLLTGIVVALATPWGLFRHYWVLYKLVITAFSTGILLLFTMQNTRSFAEMAASAEDVDMVRTSNPWDHALLALSGVMVAAVLGVYKPRALTPYGQGAPRSTRVKWTLGVIAVVVVVSIFTLVSPFKPLQFVIQLIPTPGDGGVPTPGGGGHG